MIKQASLMKVFIHIDMDCYHVQAECKRLSLDPSKPICSRQWDSLLCVNYPARELGIRKGMFALDAQRICKDVLLPHVDTFKMVQGQIQMSKLQDKFKPHSRFEEKISLQYYRDEGKLILEVIKKHFKQIERGGSDEVYIELNEEELEKLQQYESKPCGIIMTDAVQSKIIFDPNEQEQIFFRASQWVNLVRQEIKEQTQYECSAGISYNKMLAKLASAANKPNNQTIVITRYIPQCIRTFKIEKIRGFGGKINQAFQNHDIVTLAQAQDVSFDYLKQIFAGDQELANFVHQKINGSDEESLKLTQDVKNKSIQSLKDVKLDKHNKQLLKPILELLIYDISLRISNYYEDSSLVPSMLMVIYINVDSGNKTMSQSLSLVPPQESFKQTIADATQVLLSKIPEQNLYPLIHLGLSVRSFIPLKIKQLENKFTLKQYSDKIGEDSKLKLLTMVEQMVNPENYYECDQCQRTILKENEKEHQDLHFALSVDQEVNPNRKRQNQNQTQPQSKIKAVTIFKQKKLPKQSKIIKQPTSKSIMDYFRVQEK